MRLGASCVHNRSVVRVARHVALLMHGRCRRSKDWVASLWRWLLDDIAVLIDIRCLQRTICRPRIHLEETRLRSHQPSVTRDRFVYLNSTYLQAIVTILFFQLPHIWSQQLHCCSSWNLALTPSSSSNVYHVSSSSQDSLFPAGLL